MPRTLFPAAVILAAVLGVSSARANGLEATHISLPTGPASIEGLGRQFEPSLASGTASYGVTIAVPPSAGGFTPHLSLDYDSGAGVSAVGMGWHLSGMPSIRRRTENGLPKFDASDAFEISGIGIACDLLEMTPGTFRPEYESGAFVRVQRAGDGWEARDKGGTTYRFGGLGYTEAEGGNVATWLLREALDLHGHRITYTWDASSGYALLTSVVSNDYGDDVRNVMTLRYESRPDPHTLFSTGIKQVLAKRLVAVEVTHGGVLVRRYELGYAQGVHSRLAWVDLVGRDGASRFPRRSLAYTEPSFAANGQITVMATPPGRSPSDGNVEIADLDGDGLPDLLVTLAGQYRSYQNQDGSSWNPGVDWDPSQSPSIQLGTTGVQLADLDGDGALDLVAKSGTADFRYFPGKSATSFAAPVAIATVPNVTFEDPDVKLADMDGDRRTDIVITTAAGIAIGYNLNGADWTVPALVGAVDPAQALRFSDGGHTQLCDVNGDRVQDFCYLTPGHLVYWLGRGRGKFEPAQTATGIPSWDPSSPWELHDLDGDGWVDLVHVGVGQVDYALAVGAGTFDAPRAIAGTPTKGPNTTIRFADMNGSGTTDIVWIDVSGPADHAWQYLEIFPNGRAGLLLRTDNGLGGIQTFTYGPAALDAAGARKAGAPWTSRMNVAMPVVRRVESDASLGDPTRVTEYTYRNGTFAPLERTFAGFAGGIDRELGDAFTPTLVTESTFDVGLDDRTQRGLVVRLEHRSEQGGVFDRTSTSYTARTLGAPALNGRTVHYTFKSSEQVEHIEGTTASRVTLSEWEQDDYGSVTTESRWGEVAQGNKLAGNDEAITLRTYANNTGDWILGHVATEEIQDAQGSRVRAKRFYYDCLGLGLVSRGDATRSEEWIGPAPDQFELVVTTTYDADGNPLETTDGRGGGHRFQWDGHDHTTILSESIKLEGGLLTENADIDRAFGTPTRVVAYTGQATSLEYDAFGRLTATIKPGDTADRPTVRFSYDMRAPLSRIVTERRVWPGRDDVERSEGLVDGQGRKRGTLTLDDGGRWVLSDVGFYDARASERRTLRARFVSAADHDAPPLQADGPGVDFWRDALGRATRSRTQLGIETRTVYVPFVTQHWDGAQAAPDSPYEHTPVTNVVDGLGRTVANTRFLSGAAASVTLAYDAAGALVAKTDPEGNSARYAYDGRGRRTLVDDPDNGKHAFVYDQVGNLVQHHKPDGNVIRYTFDLARRSLTEDWNGDGTPEVVRAYDVSPRYPGSSLYRGMLVTMSDPSGSLEHEYDERGRLTVAHHAIGKSTYDVGSAYDSLDREYLHVFPDRSSINVHYNSRGLVAGYGAGAMTLDYDADGVLLRRAFNTGVAEISGYDDDRRRTEVRATVAGGALIQHLRWGYDAASNIVGISDLRPGVSPDKDRTEQYAYDNFYRLTGAKGTWGETHWSYSLSGSLLARTSTEASQHAGTLTYGQAAGPHAMTGCKGRTIRYDAVGRMTDDGERAFTWNGDDQLLHVERRNGAALDSVYDGDGARRIRLERTASGESHATLFLDAWSEVRDGKLVRFIAHGGRRMARLADGNGAPAVAATSLKSDDDEPPGRSTRLASLTRSAATSVVAVALLCALMVRYRRRILAGVAQAVPALGLALLAIACHGGGGDVAGGPPPILEGTIHTLGDADELLFDDAIGSLTEETSGTGAAKASFASYPFGLTRYDSSGQTNKFAGTPRDASVGLDQMGARSYAADLGVWTSVDPYRIEKPERGASESFATDHAYAYAALRPIVEADPSGRGPEAAALVANPPLLLTTAVIVTGGFLIHEVAQAISKPARTYEIRSVVEPFLQTSAAPPAGKQANSESAAPPAAQPVDKPQVKEGVYQFPDKKSPGKTYVGQSKNVPRRLRQHEKNGRIDDPSKATTTPVPGGKTAREVEEQRRINQLGGTKDTPGSQTSNKVNPIGPRRMPSVQEAHGPIPGPRIPGLRTPSL